MSADPVQEFDFEAFLESDELAYLYNIFKSRAAIVRPVGSLSTVASICIIVHILRSHHGLSTTYHRLVFGLSIGDILVSFFAFVLGGIMAPKEYDYIVPSAMGNQATCDAQGFLQMLGAEVGLFYNSSICLYYLAIVTFNKKDDYIQNKLEPWLHGISILFPLALVSTCLAIKGFNSIGGRCLFVPNIYLPHCLGLESGEIRDGFTIPCGRGDGMEHPLYRALQIIVNFVVPLSTPVVIVVTMALMYQTVYKVEKKMQKYGVGALRLRSKDRDNHVGNSSNRDDSAKNGPAGGPTPSPHDEEAFGSKCCRLHLIHWSKTNLSKISCNNACRGGHKRPRSNTVASQKRVILHRAIGYVLAWALSWIPYVLFLWGLTEAPSMVIVFSIFHPLQGVFNFVAFMLPKVKNAKRNSRRRKATRGGPTNGNHVNDISWPVAFVKAYMSRGPSKTSRHHYIPPSDSSNKKNYLQSLGGKVKTYMTVVSRNEPTMGSVYGAPINNQQQEILARKRLGQGEKIDGVGDNTPSARHDNGDEESLRPPTLQSSPLVVSKDAGDLREENVGDGEGKGIR